MMTSEVPWDPDDYSEIVDASLRTWFNRVPNDLGDILSVGYNMEGDFVGTAMAHKARELPASCTPVVDGQSSSLVASDLAQTPNINDILDLLTDFVLNPDAPVPEFHVFDKMEAFSRKLLKLLILTFLMILCSLSTQSKLEHSQVSQKILER